MQAIIPNRPARSRPYAWGSITVNPDPPQVGEKTFLGFPLANPGPDEVVVKRIDVRVAPFGIGIPWEKLSPIGPFRLPADPDHVELATLEWTPQSGGHRCVRAEIHVKGSRTPYSVGRNLQVIEACADEDQWSVSFRLGNPGHVAAPIVLTMGGNDLAALDASVRVNGRQVAAGEPLWLRGREEVEAELVLRAISVNALAHIRTVEATSFGRFIDGLQVTVRRPAWVGRQAPATLVGVYEMVGASMQ